MVLKDMNEKRKKHRWKVGVRLRADTVELPPASVWTRRGTHASSGLAARHTGIRGPAPYSDPAAMQRVLHRIHA